ncbi:MAG TPA: hypothetical protein VF054_19190 [Micromonosporaceae bacterium]
MPRPSGALLCGSMPLRSADEAMRTVASHLGPWLRRVPDGEPGPRSRWARWQARTFDEHPAFQRMPSLGKATFRYRPERHAGTPLTFPALGYAEAAAQAYQVLGALRADGILAPDVRLQVSLPTPLAVVALNLEESAWDAVLPAYHDALRREIDAIRAAVPDHDLAIQWDVAVEMFKVFDVEPRVPAAVEARVMAKLVQLGSEVPEDVELGYHLCYGDPRRSGYRPPADAGVLALVARTLLRDVRRPVTWLHLPVPAHADAAWFEPLRDLDLPEATELYLGLITLPGGSATAQRLIAAAAPAVPRFGLATPCGVGRLPAADGGHPDTFCDLLRLHAALADPRYRW